MSVQKWDCRKQRDKGSWQEFRKRAAERDKQEFSQFGMRGT